MTLTAQIAEAAERAAHRIVPPPTNPMAVARDLADAIFTAGEQLILRTHRGDCYRWDGIC